jgi:hypothetical protein
VRARVEAADERVKTVNTNAEHLIAKRHMETTAIGQLNKELQAKFAHLMALVDGRKSLLADAFVSAQYERDVDEVRFICLFF